MKIFKIVLFLFVLNSCTTPSEKQETSPEKPNIVFIFTDDQTYTSIASLGNSEIETPNMDWLVNNGTTFTNAYNMGAWNGAVCAASRAMIISGRSVWRANAYRENWKKKNDPSLQNTWSKLLENNGYDTYMTGKWHVDAPAGKIFQQSKNIRPGMPRDAWNHNKMVHTFKEKVDGKNVKPADVMPIGYNRPKDENDNSWSPTDPKFGGFWEGGKHWSEVLKDDAISFIQEAKTKENPFFMYLAFNAPHDPRQAPQEFIDKYPLDKISLPKSWLPEYPQLDKITIGQKLRDEALAPFPRTEYSIKKHLQEYYAIITHLDEQIGKILNELKASGKMENTLIFFTADHGLAMGRHGLLGKQNMYDHSIRVPLVVLGNNIPKNNKVNADVYLQDIMASSLEAAGVEKPDYVEFNSFLDLAKGKTSTSNYPAIYGAYIDLQRMIRKNNFKLIVYPKIEKVLLYDLKNDPEEMADLSKNPNYQEKMISLFKDLLQLQKDMEDELDLSTIFEKMN